MKITAIKTFIARFGNRPRALLKVETDEGLHGWGEAYSTGPDLSVEPVADYLFEMIKGEDPRRIEYIMMKLHQQFRFPPGGVGYPAISALDHALWDISGKAAGLPVYMLLGGAVRDRVRVYHGIGGASGKEAAEQALRHHEEGGFTAFQAQPLPPRPGRRPLGPRLLRGGEVLRGAAPQLPRRLRVRLRSARQDLRAGPRPAARRRPGPVRPVLLRGTAAARAHPPVGAAARPDAGAAGDRGIALRALRVPRPARRPGGRHHPAGRLHLRRAPRDAQDRRHRRSPTTSAWRRTTRWGRWRPPSTSTSPRPRPTSRS